jgi:light-regulated signal transduction histidine kinase (bacteriophytochrome)
VLELFGPRIRGRHAEIRIDALPTITADARLLAVVFENLLSNALKYGSRDQPRIAIGVVRERTRWRFHVTSAGSAIRPTDVDGIFEPFERIPGERRARGAGLGLLELVAPGVAPPGRPRPRSACLVQGLGADWRFARGSSNATTARSA